MTVLFIAIANSIRLKSKESLTKNYQKCSNKLSQDYLEPKRPLYKNLKVRSASLYTY